MTTTQAVLVRRLAVALAMLGVFIVAALAARATNQLEGRERDIRRVCQQYAGLDLSGLAALCSSVGYQETWTPEPWPYLGTIQPEDLDRTTYPTDDGG